jgi:hypothetical protein
MLQCSRPARPSTPRYAPSHQRHDQIYWVWRSQACRRCVLSPVGPYCLLTGLTGCKGAWLLRQKKMTSIFPTRPGTAASLLLLLQPCIPAATVGGHFVQPRQGRGASGRAPANQPGAASRRGRRRFSRRVLEASIGPWCVSHQPRGDCFCSALGVRRRRSGRSCMRLGVAESGMYTVVLLLLQLERRYRLLHGRTHYGWRC